ncbi:tryptophan synthase subunit alpha [Cellulomonas septica]|uniref:Tryptophan synthase alpha chain n=1 Tax=Cellulomonas septica TaxID=285080 RepID=A0ABX1K1J0_9CELL|nr:tryptophan synthase subunit alpha [Cellulomonas septica]NKY39492.1 tryptophan synthase subunit alpha [Cellulomonas septica]
MRAGDGGAPGRAALVGYLPVGFPTLPGSVDAVRAMVDAGVDVVELGVPYTDPVMDGPVIQRAVDVALGGGTRVRDTLAAVEQVAGRGAPVLVMSYWNLVLRYGVEAYARDLAAAGGAGLITPDLIPDEAQDWVAASDAHGLDRVFLVAPSSTPERLASTSAASRGFVYAASTMGVTGERATVGSRAEQLVADAQYLAQADVEQADAYRYQSTGQRGMGGGLNGVGGMVLGGILLDSILRGGGGWGGGGGGGGGGFDGGGFGDGGFGGGF